MGSLGPGPVGDVSQELRLGDMFRGYVAGGPMCIFPPSDEAAKNAQALQNTRLPVFCSTATTHS
jgi:hypothetical protein